MPRLINPMLVCLLLLCTQAARGSKQVVLPDWVRQAAHAPMPQLRPHDAAVLLHDETEVTVDPQGRAVVHQREVYKLLTAAGRPYARKLLYYEAGAKVHYLHSWTLGADDRTYQLDDKDVVDASAVPEFAVFDSARVRVAEALAAEPGAIVAFESEYTEAPFLTSWQYGLDHAIPSAGQTISLTLPAGFTHSEAWAHADPVQPMESAPGRWHWEIDPRMSIDDEPGAPEWGELAARMLLAYAGGHVAPSDGSWQTVGGWYEGLFQPQAVGSPEIKAKVAALTAGKTAWEDKLLAVTGFMQDEIRYVAVEMGIGGWQPHPARDVFRNRYGDCKDKATLLVTMLREAGITAYPLMVDFDHRIDPGMPTHFADHMIVAVEVPDAVRDPALGAVVESGGKRLLIFDPTNPVAPAGSLEPELQGTYGLLMAGGASRIIELPVLTPEHNLLERKGSFVLAADGTLTGDLQEDRRGNTADSLRGLSLNGDTRKLEEREEHAVRASLANSTITGLETRQARNRSAPLDVRYHLLANGYSKHAGQLLLVRPAVLGLYMPGSGDPARRRLYPVALGAEEAVREEYTIQLPAGLVADDLPDPVKIESPFATFENAVTLKDGALHYRRELVIRKLEVPASQYTEYLEFFSKVGNAERAEAVLKPGT